MKQQNRYVAFASATLVLTGGLGAALPAPGSGAGTRDRLSTPLHRPHDPGADVEGADDHELVRGVGLDRLRDIQALARAYARAHSRERPASIALPVTASAGPTAAPAALDHDAP